MGYNTLIQADFATAIESRNPARHAGITLEEASVMVRYESVEDALGQPERSVSSQESPAIIPIMGLTL